MIDLHLWIFRVHIATGFVGVEHGEYKELFACGL
jgi:hypothetical protein